MASNTADSIVLEQEKWHSASGFFITISVIKGRWTAVELARATDNLFFSIEERIDRFVKCTF